MDNIVLSLSVGLILGIMIASGVWAVLLALVRNERKSMRERNVVVRGITEECAEAEKIISSPAAKTMNAHGLRSALSPKVEKIRKTLMTNMHLLDIFFVKYVESLADSYQRMYSETGAEKQAFAVDKYLSEEKPVSGASSAEAALKDIRSRIEKGIATAEEALPSRAQATVQEISPARPAPPLTEEKRCMGVSAAAPVVAGGAGREAVAEPPIIDLRTGVITVEETKPSTAEEPVVGKQKTPSPDMKIEKPKAPEKGEEEFDFEKEITYKVEKKIREEAKRPVPETKPVTTEKTIQWDRNELLGLAARPEAIVVEGAEEAKPASAGQKKKGAETALPSSLLKKEEKKPDESKEDMISGEDIVDKLDSFFGFNG